MVTKEYSLPAGAKTISTTITCPSCGADVSELVCQKLEECTGIPAISFQSGDALNELAIKIQVADIALAQTGVQIDCDAIAKEVLKQVSGIISQHMTQKEKEVYEAKITALNSQIKEDTRIRAEEKQIYNDQISTLKDQINDDKIKSNDLQKQLDELKAKQKFVPGIKGGIEEEELSKRLRSIAPYDEIKLDQRYKGSTDVLVSVKLAANSEIIAGKISVESKFVSKWEDTFIEEAKQHAAKEGISRIILATTVMPPDSLNSNFDCFRSGVWIVPQYALEFAFACFRGILLETYELQKNFDTELSAIKKEKLVADQLKGILSTELFKQYAETATGLIAQAEKLESESKAMANYIQIRNSHFQSVADSVRKLANGLIEHNDDIKKKISAALNAVRNS